MAQRHPVVYWEILCTFPSFISWICERKRTVKVPCKYKCSKRKWNMYLRSNRFPHLPRPRNKKKIHQEQFQVNDTSISQSTTDALKSLPKLSHWIKIRSLATNGSHWINIFIRAQFKTTSTSFQGNKEARRISECHVY